MNDPYAIERRRLRIAELAAIGGVMASIPPDGDFTGPADTELRRLCSARATTIVTWLGYSDPAPLDKVDE